MEKYTILAEKDGETKELAVMARCHRQHIWSETRLIGVSNAGAKKLRKLKDEGHILYIVIAGRIIFLQGWEKGGYKNDNRK